MYPEQSYLENDEEAFKDVPESDDEQTKNIEELPAEQQDATKYDYNKRDPLFSNADQSCLWEIRALCNHYHPTVKKYAEYILQGTDKTIDYKGNPLLDFSMANFLDRFSFKKAKKLESQGLNNLKQKNKIRMSKLLEPFDLQGETRNEEEFFIRYYKHKLQRQAFLKKQNKKLKQKTGEEDQDDEDEIDEYADGLFEQEMRNMNQENGGFDSEDDELLEDLQENGGEMADMDDMDDDDGFDEFLNEEDEEEDMEEEDEEGAGFNEHEFQELLETSGFKHDKQIEMYKKDKKKAKQELIDKKFKITGREGIKRKSKKVKK